MLGTTIGNYKLVDTLGQGSMGVVYLGEHQIFPRRAAIKCVRPDQGLAEEAVERMIREATAASVVDHPSIITVYDVGRLPDGNLYLALEYARGETLAAALTRGALPVPRVLQLARQVSEGLAELHARGVLHRDLKPSNLIYDADGKRIKILDFGIALLLSETLKEHAETAGTPSYMSPEQVRGNELDARSDLFSLGAVLYEALAGRPAFGGGSVSQILWSILSEDPPPLAETRPETPETLAKIVTHLLEKDPADRPADAALLATRFADLERMSRGDAAREHPPGGRRPSPPPPDPTTVVVAPFRTAGGSPERAYFGDGLADSLTAVLSRDPDLKVVAAAALRSLGEAGASPIEAAIDLGAGRVCTGFAQWAGDRVRVTGELLAVPDGRVLWSAREEGDEALFFELQDRLGRGLLEALHIHGPRSTTPPGTASELPPRSTEALRLYQRGIGYLDGLSGFSLRRAEECFREALDAAPGFHRARGQLSLALMKRFLWFSRRPEELREADAEARGTLAVHPRSAIALGVVALADSLRGDYAGALARLETALEIDPNLAFLHLARSHPARFSGDIELCREASVAAVDRAPLDPFILYFAAINISEIPGEEFRAIEWLRRAMSLLPEGFDPAVRLGELYSVLYRPETAQTFFEDVLGRMPAGNLEEHGHASPRAWDGLALARLALADFDGARRAAEQAIEGGGADPPIVAHKNLAWARLGLDDRAGAVAAADEAARRAQTHLNLNPNDFEYLEGLGEILASKGDLAGAERTLRRAREINPGSHVVLEELAQVLACAGHENEALALIEELERRFPKAPGTLAARWVVLEVLGRPEAAEARREAEAASITLTGWLVLYGRLAEMARG